MREKIRGVLFIFLILQLLFAILFPLFYTTSPDISRAFLPPSSYFPFGTDRLGRDLFLLTVEGIRNSFFIALSATFFALIIGTLMGVVSGVLRGIVDNFIMRVVEIFQAFPGFLLAVAFAAFLGPSVKNVIIAISSFAWVGFARIARGITMRVGEEDYVYAARAGGIPNWRIVVMHILPGLEGGLFTQAVLTLAGSMLTEASLSFLGVGPPGLSSVGKILSESSEFILLQPLGAFLPGLLFFSVIFSLFLIYSLSSG